MKNIVITGGLGYIGTELCKLYSGESRFKNITVIDKRFISERVKQLRDWGINFIQSSILNETEMNKLLSEADVVIHLAGITDVAYVKTQSNKEQDDEIKETGILGTRNIINAISRDCKFIFPSTHVVYEGFTETRTDISETEPPCPVLTYSKTKVESEKDIIASDLNYVILRLASVYGYSADTMRLGIMPNLFSKIASQNGTISLFSGGIQLKSLVPIFDVVRCIKFMAENESISREIFHLSKETVTVKEVANLCKEINPKLNIVETDEEIPNLGYTLSNKKLLATGFEFRYNLKECLEEMIYNWSKKDINPELEYVDRGGNEYIDSRGKILNYELTEPINLIGYIESKTDTVRANHYHPIQEQKCLLVKGQYISVIKDLSFPDAPIETKIINEGDIAIIKPNVAHAMVFTKDSIFLNLVRGERDHKNYGISHTIPYLLVDETFKNRLLSTYKPECRSCGNIHLDRVVSLGISPLANNLKSSIEEESEMYPLEVNYCKQCHNCQLSVVVDPQKMFDNYLYVSSTTASFRKHFEDASSKYIHEFGLDSTTLVVDIGSNDGIALKPLMEKGIPVIGVEPASNIAKLASDNKIPTINKYFDTNVVSEIIQQYGKAKLITASNVFAHSSGLVDISRNVFKILDNDGTFIIEVQYIIDTIRDLTFDNIYHEHVNYWSVTSLNNFFNKLNLSVYKVEHIDTHGGSIRVYIKRDGCRIDNSVADYLKSEEIMGISDIKIYKKFGKRVADIKEVVNKNMKKLKEKYGKKIAAYGSPAKATTSLNYFGINADDISYTIEDNQMKNGKFIPGVNIPIKNKQYCKENLPEIIIVLAWNFFEIIKANNKELIDLGVQFINIKDLQDIDFVIHNENKIVTKVTNNFTKKAILQ